ncbi:MAG: GAF domain-containing protein [Comamonadaceae bacterium]|nr:MAG: GAF domain-containing protein [Comamonadaceae bacterium]
MNGVIGNRQAVAEDGAAEIVHASASTRVIRQGSPGRQLLLKMPLGADAPKRVAHEKAMLEQLADVAGVARLAAGNFPPGVLALQDAGVTTLAQRLAAGHIDTPSLLVLASQLARTVTDMHRAGVIHRDINPANILMTPDGSPVLIDFDQAMPAEQLADVIRQDGIVGTLAYLSPEQTGRTGRAVDQRSDLYSLGVTLYEMACGKLPFEARDALQLIHDHLVRVPVPPALVDARVPRPLSDIIMRLLAKAPEQRYQSAWGLQHDLRRLDEELAGGGHGVFELGEHDFTAQLLAPASLVGRAAELSVLRAAFADSLLGPRTVLVAGAAGVGKSALINQLRPWVTAAGGWFIQGKFDQYQREAATSGAITQAARALGRLLLAQSVEEIVAQRKRILASLGRNAGLMTRLSPEYAVLLGEQPDVPELDPRQAELHMQQAVLELLGAIASPERPLVILLDDLQWAGALSLRGFGRLMAEPSLRGILLVGAYRPEEVDPGHVLAPMLQLWRAQRHPPVHIVLPELTAGGMGELVGSMLRLPPGPAGRLAAAVGALTGGNPFDTVEMINALRRDRVLRMGEGGWEWDEGKVRRFVGRGNVMDLLAARLARLPQPSRELLEFMSCLGNEVRCGLLAAATGLDDAELQRCLRAPLEDGLLVAVRGGGADTVQFRHDRVQQVVLGAMDGTQRSLRQLAMARCLQAVPAYESDAAQQYLACAGLIDEPGEQGRAAELFLRLAGKLSSTATWLLAERYLAAASGLLAAVEEAADDRGYMALRSAVGIARHAALYSLGRLEEADPVHAALQSWTPDPLDLVEPACLQMRSLYMRGKTREGKALGLRMLAALGLEVPHDYALPDMARRLDELNEWVVRDRRLSTAARPQIRDPRLLAIAKLLGRLARPAYFESDRTSFAWLLLTSQRLWAEHGTCPELVASLGRLASMLINLRQDYRAAYEVSRHIMGVGEALDYGPHASEARFIYATYASHWFEPLEHTVRHFKRAYDEVLGAGDLSWAGYVHAPMISAVLEVAPTIEASEAEVEAGMAVCLRAGNAHAAAQHTCELQMLRALRGQTRSPDSFEDAQFNEQAFLARVGNLPYVEYTYVECRALHGLVMGDRTVFIPNALYAMTLTANLSGYYMMVFGHFFCAMARAWQLQGDGPEVGGKYSAADRTAALDEYEFCRQWLQARAADQPHNFLYMLRLVEAERAWATGELWEAAAAFDEALGEVRVRARPWHCALVTERAGRFHLSRGLGHTGRALLAEAAELYRGWGATAKVDQMRAEHAFLRAANRERVPGVAGQASKSVLPAVSPDALDLMGVLRASQALSSETSIERLAARVTQVLAALSGATRVRLLSWQDGHWWLIAPEAGEASIPLALAAERGLVPLSAIGYAERTEEPLLVDDVLADDRFARDSYFAGQADCSLLLVPIISHGGARTMICLENRLGRAAFNAQRLDAVMLIAGQLAVSLANAQLYESLEQRVHARTRELEQTQAELVTTARRAGMAEIANNVLHNVGNVLNSVNVSARVVRSTIGNSKVEGLARAVALLNEHEHDLAGFIAHDPRGMAFRTYLNELVIVLGAERHDVLGDLDRLTSSVDHITYVVATQQSHAGPSSVREMAVPQELVEEALRLSADAILRFNVTVVRRFDTVPAAALDRQRLLQILVNLIANASQAMHGISEDLRRLTVGIHIAAGEGGGPDDRRLCITVGDEGEGIAQEDLTRIFAHGFTTRKDGHGFGLHSSALAAMEMGGRLAASSKGAGRGAVFTVELPMPPAVRAPRGPAAEDAAGKGRSQTGT